MSTLDTDSVRRYQEGAWESAKVEYFTLVSQYTPADPTPEPLTDIARDALYKASESIKEGMWCVGSWFERTTKNGKMGYEVGQLLGEKSKHKDTALSLEDAIKSRRCAEGEVALQIALLGGEIEDYYNAVAAVTQNLHKYCPMCVVYPAYSRALAAHNDAHVESMEDREGHLSELFRDTADTAP